MCSDSWVINELIKVLFCKNDIIFKRYIDCGLCMIEFVYDRDFLMFIFIFFVFYFLFLFF